VAKPRTGGIAGQTRSAKRPKRKKQNALESSEEYKNFETFAGAILAIPADEAEQIRKQTSHKKKESS
jgi:hypothetical protein